MTFQDIIEMRLRLVGEMLVNETKINITGYPLIDTGVLRDSISYEVEEDELTVGTNVEYSIYQELGTGLFAVNGDGRQDVPWRYKTPDGEWRSTKGLHPSPFLRPALTDNIDRIKKILGGGENG